MRPVLIVVTALVAVSEAINPYAALYATTGYGYGIGTGAGLHNPHHHNHNHQQEETPMLTCAATFSHPNHNGGLQVTDGVAVNIMERGAGQANNHHHHGISPLLSPYAGAFAGAYGALAAGGGLAAVANGANQGLEVTMELFSQTGGDVTVMITDRGFTGEGCVLENFGEGLPADNNPAGALGATFGLAGAGLAGAGLAGAGLAGAGLAGAGLLGAGVGLAGAGLAVPGYGLSLGFASPNLLGAPPQAETNPDGVLATDTLQPGVPKVISRDRLNGYQNINSMAGRGVMVCTETSTNYGGAAKCTGEVLSCCVLAYDNQARSLELGGYHH